MAVGDFVAAFLDEGNGGKGARDRRRDGSIRRRKRRQSWRQKRRYGVESPSGAPFGPSKGRNSDIGVVEGLGEFGDDELAPVGDLGGDDAGAIAPVVLADGQGAGGDGIAGGGSDIVRGGALVVAALAAEFAVGIAGGLLGLVVAVLDIGFGVVFLDPGDDVLGVEGDRLGDIGALGARRARGEWRSTLAANRNCGAALGIVRSMRVKWRWVGRLASGSKP